MTVIPDPIRAADFAAVKHGNQSYNDEIPYIRHLEMVVTVLNRFGFTDNIMICAGNLHDVCEDTGVSYSDIKDRFGIEVAELVYAVTNEKGRNRKERNFKTYGQIHGRFFPTALKLADRIANVEYGIANGGKQDMYAKEWPSFHLDLYWHPEKDGNWRHEHPGDGAPGLDDLRVERMWNYLRLLLGDPYPPGKLSANDAAWVERIAIEYGALKQDGK